MRRLIGSMVIVALAGLTVAAALNRGAQRPDARMRLQGRWHGTLGEPQDSTIVFIDVDTLAHGRWIVEADIPSQDVRDFPLSTEVTGDTVRFHLSRSGGEGPVLTFVLSARGDELNGTFAQSGTEMPARLSRIGPPEISGELRSMSRDASGKFDVTVLSADARELRAHFNAHADRVRLVMLLSPT